MQKFFLILLLFSFNYSFGQNIFSKESNQKIWEAKDRQDVVYTKHILKNGTDREKILALKGLYSWYDAALKQSLLFLGKKGSFEVKSAVFQAIGQTGDSSFVPFIVKNLHKRKNKNLKPVILVSLGKCVSKSQKKFLINELKSNQPGLSESLYRAMLRGINDAFFLNQILENLQQNDKDNRFYAAWYLSRNSFLNSKNHQQILQLVEEAKLRGLTSDITIPLLIGLGKAKLESKDSMLFEKKMHEIVKMWLQSGNQDDALNLIATFKAAQLGHYFLAFDSFDLSKIQLQIKNPSVQVALSEIITIQNQVSITSLNLDYSPAILNILGSNQLSVRPELIKTNTFYDKIWSLKTLENRYQYYSQIKGNLLQAENAAIKVAGTESLIKCYGTENFPLNLVSDFYKTLEVLIQDGDEGVLSIIANSFLDKSIPLRDSSDKSNFIRLFSNTSLALELPGEMEAFIDIQKVIAFFNQTKYVKPIPEWNHPIDWNHVSKIAGGQKIRLTTTKGNITILLNVNEAPGSVSSILKLVETGYYDMKYFHRLVSNFVVQGGCPRGDGFGSLNYSIRSEFSPQSYSTGAVGIASSGPNTECCQLFITHCPTPHLDGRYTIIGFVVDGMETVHKLGVSDQILKAVLL